MAPNKSYLYIREETIPSDSPLEFDESELWDSSELVISEHKQFQKTHPLPLKIPSRRTQLTRGSAAATSLPVNVPDWSKILRNEHNVKRRESDYDDDDDVDEDDWMPPHEYLARTRMAPLSVHEGVGRTLKGRDLSRVRNAIWKHTGFELD